MLNAVTVALVGLLFGLAGCASLHEADRVGEGPLTLSPTVVEGFERYKRGYRTGYFAVSRGGTAGGYNGCGSVYDRCWGVVTADKAIAQCEKRSGGEPCYTFAIDHRIVWQGYEKPTSTARPSYPSGLENTDKPTASRNNDDAVARGQRPFALYWEKEYGSLVGEVSLGKESDGPIKMNLPDGHVCSGFYINHRDNGAWSFSCSNGKAASGTLRSQADQRGAHGEGQDMKGNRVELRLANR